MFRAPPTGNGEILNSVAHRMTDGFIEAPKLDPTEIRVLGRLIYLADWKSAIETGATITDVPWRLSRFAPDLVAFAEELYGTEANLSYSVTRDSFTGHVVLTHPPTFDFTQPHEDAMQHIVDTAFSFDGNHLQKLVESTYGIYASDEGPIDILRLAEDYNQNYRHQPLAS